MKKLFSFLYLYYNSDVNNKRVAKKESLNWAIRQAKAYLSLNSEEEATIDKLLQRNEVEHEYVNSKYNKQNLMDYAMTAGRVKCLTSIIDKIEDYIQINIK